MSSAGNHTHIYNDRSYGGTVSKGRSGGRVADDYKEDPQRTTRASGNHTHNIQNNGNWNAAEAHENRPPYYVLAYIMRVR